MPNRHSAEVVAEYLTLRDVLPMEEVVASPYNKPVRKKLVRVNHKAKYRRMGKVKKGSR